ncbi:hypothetical protein FRB90_012672 [Tulasnella sp. 427]|nr:hypothetical protein FRB90_012672 [Tulasnella sp. 427]
MGPRWEGLEHYDWDVVAGDLHDGLYPSEDPLYLYYQVKKPLAGIPAGVELQELVTELDVQYGDAKHIAWSFNKANIPVTLAAEKPSLVVFTGDQLNGQTTSWDAQSVLLKAIGETIAAKIPWALVFGNHDDQDTDLTRSEMMKIAKRMPYAVPEMEEGPQWVDGVGNWLVKVRSADASATHILTLYFLDSHGYAKTGWTFWKPADYDWIKQSQIDWYLEQSALIAPIERPFTPDGAKDLGTVWKARQAAKRLAKPNAMMFFHIPLPESFYPADVSDSGETLLYGQQLDDGGAPKKNSGFFEKGLLKGKESDDPANTKHEVKVVANGHCHITDFCKRVKGVWLCFGGGSSFSGYGRIGFDRRFRVYEISNYGETIRTYKRGQDGKEPHKLLLIPGPIEVSDEVLYANAHPSMSHVSPDFVPVFGDCIRMLRQVPRFHRPNTCHSLPPPVCREVLFTADGQPILVAGSGTLGWDQVASNLIEAGEEALVLNSGYFGDSFADCLTTYGAKVTELKADVGAAPTPAEVEAALKAKQYKLITITHVDTSTGVLSDAKGICEIVKRVSPNTLVILDGVCSVASEEIRFDEWGLDVVLTATQKGLGTPPGLSVLCVSQKALKVSYTA